MPLETDYINPNVILTTRVTSDFSDQVKYVKCAALILLTILICFFGPIDAFGWIVLTLGAWWGALWYLKRRPTIILEGRTRKIHLSGITKFGKPQSLPHNLVEKVTVMEDVIGRARGQYVPQLVLKGFKGGGKKLIINCFPGRGHYPGALYRPAAGQLLPRGCLRLQRQPASHFIDSYSHPFSGHQERSAQVGRFKNEKTQGWPQKVGRAESRILILHHPFVQTICEAASSGPDRRSRMAWSTCACRPNRIRTSSVAI